MIKTVCCLPPPIQQYFNPLLLMEGHDRKKHYVENKIIPLSLKKIRSQDVGKRRQFDKQLKEFYQVYERKKIEKANYDAKIKEAAKKRPSLPATGGTCRFTRMEPQKLIN